MFLSLRYTAIAMSWFLQASLGKLVVDTACTCLIDIISLFRICSLLTDCLGTDNVTHFEVPGGHHGLVYATSLVAFKVVDAVALWLTAFEQRSIDANIASPSLS